MQIYIITVIITSLFKQYINNAIFNVYVKNANKTYIIHIKHFINKELLLLLFKIKNYKNVFTFNLSKIQKRVINALYAIDLLFKKELLF